MRRLIAILTSVTLAVMTTGTLPAGAPDRIECGQGDDSSCEQSCGDQSRAPVPVNCCIALCVGCCAAVLSTSVEVARPGTRVIGWQQVTMSGTVRTDKPPLPPPRAV